MAKKFLPFINGVHRWFRIRAHLDGLFALLERSYSGLGQLFHLKGGPRGRTKPARWSSFLPQVENLECRVVPTNVQFATYAAPALTVYEAGVATYVNVNVSLDSEPDNGNDVYVDYATSDGGALAGRDYSGATGTLDFAPGQTSQTITVPILGAMGNGNVDFTLALANAVNADLGSLNSTDITINEPANLPGVNFKPSSQNQAVTYNAGVATFEVDLTEAASQATSVDFYTQDGTATSADYNGCTGTLTFNAGDTSATFSVSLTGQQETSNPEFSVFLSNPVGLILGSHDTPLSTVSATVTLDEEYAPPQLPTVYFSQSTQVIGYHGSAQVFIYLSSPSDVPVTVHYATSDDSAENNRDYTPESGTATIQPGQLYTSISIPTLRPIERTGKDFFVTLSDPTNADLGAITQDNVLIRTSTTIVFTPANATYNGQDHTTMAEVFGVDGVYLGLASVVYSSGSNPRDAGTYTATAIYYGNPDYAPMSLTETITITRATPIILVAPVDAPYNGAAQPTIGEVYGVGDVDLGPATMTYFNGTTALSGAPLAVGSNYLAMGSFVGNTDYTSASDSGQIIITKPRPTLQIVCPGGVYTGSPYTATVTVAGISGTPASTLESAAPTWTYFSVSTDSSGNVIQTSLGSTAPTAVGSYSVTASFAGSADYGPQSVGRTFTITKALPTVTVTDAGGAHTGSTYPATATVTGAGGASLSGATISYFGSDGSTLAGAPSAAGNYIAVASFAGAANYAAAVSQPVSFTIGSTTNKPTLQITAAGGPYTGSPFTATAMVTPPGGSSAASLGGVSPTFVYVNSQGQSLAGAPTEGGTYTVLALYAGTSSYAAASAAATFTIRQANPVIAVSAPGGAFTHGPMAATATLKDAQGDLITSSTSSSSALSLTYYDNSGNTLAGAPGETGNYTVIASFPGNADYSAVISQPVAFLITPPTASNKATPTVQLSFPASVGSGHNYIFSGTAVNIAATVTGTLANQDDTAAATLERITPTLVYDDVAGHPLNGEPVHSGTYWVQAFYAGSLDYGAAHSSNQSFTIEQAVPTITLHALTVPYDGRPHDILPTVTGLPGVTLNQPRVTYVDATTHATLSGPPVAAGTYTATATYPGNADYTTATGSTTITINAATATEQGSTLASGGQGVNSLVGFAGVSPASGGGLLSFGPSNSVLADTWNGNSSPISGGAPQASGVLSTSSPGQTPIPGSGFNVPAQVNSLPSTSPLADAVNDPAGAGVGSLRGGIPTVNSPNASPQSTQAHSLSFDSSSSGGSQWAFLQPYTGSGGHAFAAQAFSPAAENSSDNSSGGGQPYYPGQVWGFVYNAGTIYEALNRTDWDYHGDGSFNESDGDTVTNDLYLGNGEIIHQTFTYSDVYVGSGTLDSNFIGLLTLTITTHVVETDVIDPTPVTGQPTIAETDTTVQDSYLSITYSGWAVTPCPLLTGHEASFTFTSSEHDTFSGSVSGGSTLAGANSSSGAETYSSLSSSTLIHNSSETDTDNNGSITGTLGVSDSTSGSGSWTDNSSSEIITSDTAGNHDDRHESFSNTASYNNSSSSSLNGNRSSLTFTDSQSGADAMSYSDYGSDLATDIIADGTTETINEPNFAYTTSSGAANSYSATYTILPDESETLQNMNSTDSYTSSVVAHDESTMTDTGDSTADSYTTDNSHTTSLEVDYFSDGSNLKANTVGSTVETESASGTNSFSSNLLNPALSLGQGPLAAQGAQALAGLTGSSSWSDTDSGKQAYSDGLSNSNVYHGHQEWNSAGELVPAAYTMDILTIYATKQKTTGSAKVSADQDGNETSAEDDFHISVNTSDSVHEVYSGMGDGATMSVTEKAGDTESEKQTGTDSADVAPGNPLELPGSTAPQPLQPGAVQSPTAPAAGTEMNEGGSYNDFEGGSESAQVGQLFVFHTNSQSWALSNASMTVTSGDHFKNQDGGNSSTTDSGADESDGIGENFIEKDAGNESYTYVLSLSASGGSLNIHGGESDTSSGKDVGNDQFKISVNANDPLSSMTTPTGGTANNVMLGASVNDTANGNDTFISTSAASQAVTLNNMSLALVDGAWTPTSLSATFTQSDTTSESDSGGANASEQGGGANDSIGEDYTDSVSGSDSLTLTVSGTSADDCSITESGGSTNTYSEMEEGNDNFDDTESAALASMGAAPQPGSSSVAAANQAVEDQGNDHFKINVGGTTTVTLDNMTLTVAGGVTTLGGYTMHVNGNSTSTETDSGSENLGSTDSNTNDSAGDSYSDSDRSTSTSTDVINGDANGCTVVENDTETDATQSSATSNDSANDALTGDPLAATLDGSAGGTTLTGSDRSQVTTTGGDVVTIQQTSALAGGVWSISAFHEDIAIPNGTTKTTASGTASDGGGGSASGNNVSENYDDEDTQTSGGGIVIDGTGDGQTITLDEHSSDVFKDSFGGNDSINTGSGSTAVHDTDNFSVKDAGSSSDTVHAIFGMVAGNMTLQSYSETFTAQDSAGFADSGSDQSGTVAAVPYDDKASKTGSETINISSGDGINFTESDNEDDPYIFTDNQTPSSGPADTQTGYVALTMHRTLTWGSDGVQTVTGSSVGGDGAYQDAVKGNGTFRLTGGGNSSSFSASITQDGISAIANLAVGMNTSGDWMNTFFGAINQNIQTGVHNATSTGGSSTVTDTITATSGGGQQLVRTTPTTTETILYNSAGQVLSDVLALTGTGQLLRSRSYTYDSVGRELTATQGGQTTKWTYDDAGHKTSEVVGYGSAQAATTTYGYDAMGDLTSVTDPNHNTTTYTYDDQGHQTSMTDPLGHLTYETYNSAGELASVTTSNGLKRTMLYTTEGQLATETWYAAGGTTVVDTLTYTYYDLSNDLGNTAADGKLKTAGNSAGTYTFQYDTNGRVNQVTEPFGVALSFGYDALGNRTQVTDSFGGTTTSQYDTTNQLVAELFSQGGTAVLNVGESYVNPESTSPSSISYYQGTGPSQLVANSAYTYDAAGRLTDLAQTGPSGGTLADYQQTYNSGNQLTSQTIAGAVQNYTYDGQGEITGAYGKTYGYDANGNRTMSGYVIGADNQVLSDGVYSYSYDQVGNEATKTNIGSGDQWTYTYDNINHLTKAVEKTGAGVVELTAIYKYDVFGNRIEKDVTQGTNATITTKFAYDGWNPATPSTVGNENFSVWADLNAGGSLATRYIHGDVVDQLFARVSPSGTPSWYLVDNQGSVRNIVSNSGTVLDSINYDAYGNIITTGSLAETNASQRGRYAWTGRELDVESGLQYNRARYYDSGTGRWISQDPMGFDAGDSNLYRYVNNKPMEATDPSGKDSIVVVGSTVYWQNANGMTSIIGTIDADNMVTLSHIAYDQAGKAVAKSSLEQAAGQFQSQKLGDVRRWQIASASVKIEAARLSQINENGRTLGAVSRASNPNADAQQAGKEAIDLSKQMVKDVATEVGVGLAMAGAKRILPGDWPVTGGGIARPAAGGVNVLQGWINRLDWLVKRRDALRGMPLTENIRSQLRDLSKEIAEAIQMLNLLRGR